MKYIFEKSKKTEEVILQNAIRMLRDKSVSKQEKEVIHTLLNSIMEKKHKIKLNFKPKNS